MHRAAIVLAIAGLMSAAAPAAASGAQSSIAADLEGSPIAVTMIADYYCHDRDFPRIHCFRSAAALERARAAGPSASSATTAPATASASSDYVEIFSSQLYQGSYMVISQNYDALALIGWNDRIESYIAINNASGVFYTDWFHGGYLLTFCCNGYAPTLSPTFNNAISSVYRT